MAYWREISVGDVYGTDAGLPWRRDVAVELIMGWAEQFEIVTYGHNADGRLASVLVKSDRPIPKPELSVTFLERIRQERIENEKKKER